MRSSQFARPGMSHPYDHFQMYQAALLREAEYERLAAQATREQEHNMSYHTWTRWLGLHLINWGEHLLDSKQIDTSVGRHI